MFWGLEAEVRNHGQLTELGSGCKSQVCRPQGHRADSFSRSLMTASRSEGLPGFTAAPWPPAVWAVSFKVSLERGMQPLPGVQGLFLSARWLDP